MIRPLLLVLVVIQGCTGPQTDPSSVRTIKLRLIPPNSSDEAFGGTRSVQLAAAQVRDGQLAKLSVGDAIDGRMIQTLSVGVPINTSVNLFLQTPRGSNAGPGIFVGRVVWSNGHGQTSRIPASDLDIDLGEVSFMTGDPGTLADNRLPVTDDANPLRRTNRDGDAQDDFLDDDDDGDSDPDATDADADGDGEEDARQEFSALPDGDGDGVPNDFE